VSEVFVGKPAPDFTIPDQNGQPVTLSDYQGKQNVVLLFYPLDWTPV
jgi:peroxiredoxin